MNTLVQRRRVLGAGGTLLAGLCLRNSPARADDADGLADPATIAAVPAKALPDLAFSTPQGAVTHLSAYRGAPLVLNFWATWCGPCVKELPELDALAATGVHVVAASADHGGAGAVTPFLARHPLAHLTVLLDPSSAAVHQVDVFGFPATLIIDAQGRLRGRLDGPAKWSAAAARVRALTA